MPHQATLGEVSCAHLSQPIPVRTAHRTQTHTHTGHGDKHTQAHRDGTRDSHKILPIWHTVFSCDSDSVQRLQSLHTDIRHACFVSHCPMWAVSWVSPSYFALWHTSCAYSHTRCAHGAHAGCSRVGYGPSHDVRAVSHALAASWECGHRTHGLCACSCGRLGPCQSKG